MNGFNDLSPIEQAHLDAAAEWQLRLRKEPHLELSAEYRAWIAHAENLAALEAVEAGWTALSDLGASPELLTLRRAALARVQKAGARHWFPRRSVIGAMAAVFAIALAGSGALYSYLHVPLSYRTDVGERRVVALPDGSRVSMDSDTEVTVRYSENARALELGRGRARFDVAHDVTRPFTVQAGNETVVAVGTSFNVERLGSSVLVTLIQGHVVIKGGPPSESATVSASRPKPSVSLNAGEELVVKADAPPAITIANLQAATAWEAGHLIFHDATLAEAVERVNRYTDKPITVDPAIAAIRISGVFNAGDIGSFVSTVTSYFPVQATTNAANEIVLQRHS